MKLITQVLSGMVLWFISIIATFTFFAAILFSGCVTSSEEVPDAYILPNNTIIKEVPIDTIGESVRVVKWWNCNGALCRDTVWVSK